MGGGRRPYVFAYLSSFPPEVDGAARDGDQGSIQLPRLIGVPVTRRWGGRGQGQEIHDDLSVSVGGEGINSLLLDSKSFHPRSFQGSKVIYRLIITPPS